MVVPPLTSVIDLNLGGLTRKQIEELAKPFPPKYVHQNPSGGGSYVKHHVINQRLIHVLGQPPGFKLVEIIRGDVPAIAPNPQGKSKRAQEGAPALTNVIVGVVARLTSPGLEPAEDCGDCEEPHNWKTDGQRLKDAMSDAYKRCAMRWGCGLHLWSQDEYFLHEALVRDSGAEEPGAGPDTSRGASGERAVSEDAASPSPVPHTLSKPSGKTKRTADPTDPEAAFWNAKEKSNLPGRGRSPSADGDSPRPAPAASQATLGEK